MFYQSISYKHTGDISRFASHIQAWGYFTPDIEVWAVFCSTMLNHISDLSRQWKAHGCRDDVGGGG